MFSKERKLGSEIFDICIYHKNWQNEYYFVASKEDLSQKMNWVNITFSQPILFFI